VNIMDADSNSRVLALRKAEIDATFRRQEVHAVELVNAITHGIGLVLSIVGAVALIVRSHSHGDAYLVAGCTVFSMTLIAVYGASTLSHVPLGPRLRRLFRRLDQGAIYLLIVGTCMPFALVYLRTGWWLLFFGLMWTAAWCGFVSKTLFSHRVDAVAIWIYVILGWMPIATVPSLMGAVPATVLWWMLVGGLFYTCGTLFLACDDRYPLLHGVWHLFVVAGSTCHFLTIFSFVGDLT
jgi:hemolysin III